MNLGFQSNKIFRSVSTFQKASPIIVHLAMVVGVGLYAVFGALIMQRLETKPVIRSRRALDQTGMLLENTSVPTSMESHLSIENTTTLTTMRHRRDISTFGRTKSCVIRALKKLMDFDCDSKVLDRMIVRMIENCYHVSVRDERSLNGIVFKNTNDGVELATDQAEYVEPWSFSDAILFSFTIITTIGYGNIAPQSFSGRLFCIVYGFIGIPFTLLAIADLGKFFSEIIEAWQQRFRRIARRIRRKWRRLYNRSDMALSMTSINFSTKDLSKVENGDEKKEGESKNDKSDDDSEEELEPLSHTLPLMGIFIVYSLVGAVLLSLYEPEMNFFKAIYFNFITLTSIGLGDVIPKSESFLWLTLLYIAIGLALTTIAIDLAADYLKRLHYYGRKIQNAGNVAIWFGGKSLTVRQLVKNLGDQFNLPVTTILHLNLDKFVDDAIKVEEGELETLRPPPIEPSDVIRESPLTYADEDEEPWLPMNTPDITPSPSPEPLPDPIPESEEEPVIEEKPKPLPPKPKELTPEELLKLKRRNYSEEAWRRYQEYQKQWRRFRQTKDEYPGPSSARRRSSAASTNQKYEQYRLMVRAATTAGTTVSPVSAESETKEGSSK